MPIKLKEGKTVKNYRVVKQFDPGANALSYLALSPSGEKVFLKQYKTPTCRSPWFRGYVDYQKEIKRRIEADAAAKNLCYRFIEFFEQKDFFQVFEFVEVGMSLSRYLETLKSKPKTHEWTERTIFAKVLMHGMASLHKIGVIHSDLKPDNIFLIADPLIDAKYKVRVIDLDFSVLEDQRAPWLGEIGYMGTVGYLSPEHLGLNGGHVLPASDVFTCGIMLAQLLCVGHPYAAFLEDGDALADAVKNGRFQKPKLLQSVEGVEDGCIESVIEGCLNPCAEERPTAAEVREALKGTPWKEGTPTRSKPSPASKSEPKSSAKPSVERITLVGSNGQQVSTSISSPTGMTFGKRNLASLGEDAQYCADPQFTLYLAGPGAWMIRHHPDAPNETLVNGKAVQGEMLLAEGARVAVGREAKGIEKLPMTCHLG
jgi:serine/threonine protein kinase